MIRHGIAGVAVLASLLASCATERLPPTPNQGLISSLPGGVPGYQHGAAGSKFVLGEGTHQTVQHGYLKLIGDEGTLATRLSNGSVFGVPNSISTTRKSTYGGTPDEHNAFVSQYFRQLGLPSEQVANVRAMTLLEASGRSSDPSAASVPQILAYYSVIERGIDGIPVPDSFAWARATSAGTVVQEGVYWPALPPEVMAEARRFKTMMANARGRRSFLSRLPVDGANGIVSIRHASASEDRFEAFASFDVTVLVSPSLDKRDPLNARRPQRRGGGAAVVRHFDISGKERRLPQEELDLADQYPERK